MKIVIIDDDPLVCGALKIILQTDSDLEIAAVGTSGGEAISLYERCRPDVLLMDIRMADMTGLKAGAAILQRYPDARILFLTTFSDDEYIIEALRIGSKGYLIKQDFESILPALKAVASGQSVFGSEIVGRLPDLMNREKKPDLSSFGIYEREQELIRLVAAGLSNREIAEKLAFSEGTIRNYLSQILEKLDLRDRTQLAVFYYRNGRLSP